MKICLIITKSELGGAQTHVLELVRGIISESAAVSVAVGERGWLVDRLLELGVTVEIVPNLVHPVSPLKDILALLAIRKWLLFERPQVVHLHSSKAGLLGRIAAFLSGIPAIYTAHGWAFTGGSSLLRKLVAVPSEWVAARLGYPIICVSRYDFDRARKYKIAPVSRLLTIHNGIEDSPCRAILTEKAKPVIVMVARFAHPKDFKTLIKALAILSDESFEAWLVGSGPDLADTVKLVEECNLQHKIRFLGNRSDVPELLARADVFVLTSRFEGLPISIIEAMRAGLPIVASSVGGIPELVEGCGGFLVRDGDVTSVAMSIRQLLRSDELRQHSGSRSRMAYEESFTEEMMISQTISLYRRQIEFSRTTL